MRRPPDSETTMRFTLLLHYAEPEPGQLSPQAQAEAQDAFAAYAATLAQAEVLIAAEVLQPSGATTTVRRRDGVLQVQDGPYADTAEQLAGTFVIDVAGRDDAIRWAGEVPLVEHGWVEVRPGAVRYVDGAWRASA